jgi:hypothetical protein
MMFKHEDTRLVVLAFSAHPSLVPSTWSYVSPHDQSVLRTPGRGSELLQVPAGKMP